MYDVQLKLAEEGIFKQTSVSFGCLNADKNFAMLKRQHVGRPLLTEKLPMQARHSTIGNEPDENVS